MKHDLKITLILILFFVLAQIVGLLVVNYKLNITEKGIGYNETVLGEIPQTNWQVGLLYVILGVSIGTLLVLLIIRLKKVRWWKVWFFVAVFLAMSLALGVFLNIYLTFILAFILALLKIYRPNVVIHNVTEVLMYSGISLLIVGFFKESIIGATILLIVISLYDIYAVFKSKHMVKMAKFQAKSKVFAGLFIPYAPKKHDLSPEISKLVKSSKSFKAKRGVKKIIQRKNAILGGGDIAFPLIFTGVVMHKIANSLYYDFGLTLEVAKATALYQSLIITLTTTIALALLFIFAKKDKFYPAMPFISAGCFIGYLIILLL